VPLSLSRFDELSRTTPFLLNVRPFGKYLMVEDFFYAGGLPVPTAQLDSCIRLD
jgi:dihydroxyacid dehydratase/phosphogluconate dehydratase